MNPIKTVQLLAGYSHADAISNEARTIRSFFRDRGHESIIVCEEGRILPELLCDTIPLHKYIRSARHDDLIILHFSTGSLINDRFMELPGRKAMIYHNITPPEYLFGIHKGLAANLELGRKQLHQLKDSAQVVMAVSRFNAAELEAAGYRNVHILPLLIDWNRLSDSIDPVSLQRWQDGTTNILFVGRCAPNKKWEDVIYAFHFFQRYVQPHSRLIFVGSHSGTEKYMNWLRTLVRKNEMENIEMAGALNQDQLNAAFRAADLFLCMSEHEGFCIPLLEAMEHNIPVLAYDAGAVAETMNGAGVLFSEKKFDQIAEMMGQLTTPSACRTAIINAQQRRIQRYKKTDLAAQLQHCLAPFLGKDEVRQQPK